jgi:hypothetical protein
VGNNSDDLAVSNQFLEVLLNRYVTQCTSLISSESLPGCVPVTVKIMWMQAGTWEVYVGHKEACLFCEWRHYTSILAITNITVTDKDQ